MRAALVALLAACVACANVPAARRPLPAIPPPTDVEALLPPPRPPLPIAPGAVRFPTRPIDAGECKGLPAGMLVSEVVYAQLLDGLAERNRLRAETAALRKLRADERAICLQLEQAYQARVSDLERDLASAGRGLLWKAGAAFALGALLALGAARAAR